MERKERRHHTRDERWATDLCRIWTGRDHWTTLALVIDCHTRSCWGGTCRARARPRQRRRHWSRH
jgi:hypothetical protein